MATMNKLDILSTRNGFNSAVRHIKGTIGIVEDIGSHRNLADILYTSEEEDMTSERLAVLLRMLLADKMGYKAISRNLDTPVDNLASIAKELSSWKAVDLVLAYYHPDLGLVIANPKDEERLSAIGPFRKRELVVIYAGCFEKGANDLCAKAAKIVIDMLEGGKPAVPKEMYSGDYTFKPAKKQAKEPAKKSAPKAAKAKPGRKPAAAKAAELPPAVVSVKAPVAPAPAPVTAKGPSRMTPMYSVVVQNELFHNGNVEAWKRIIESYRTKYPSLDVYIYYDGERIMNINSLFKWGKVKHGSTIQFAVCGSDIRDVAKLQRYLIQGASPQFEAFLHGPVSTVLKLF